MNYSLFKDIHGLAGHNHLIDAFMIFCTNKAIYIFALALLLIWLFGNKSYKRDALYAGITGIVGLIANVIISHIYFEPRPFVTHHVHTLISHAADASFPSDHATGSFAIAFFMLMRHRKIGGLMLILALLTGFSRIYCGIHYPFDVVGSIVVAFIVTFVINKLAPILDPLVNAIISLYQSIIGKLRGRSSEKTIDQ